MLLALNLQAFFTYDLTLVRVTRLSEHLEHQRSHDATGYEVTLDGKRIERMYPTVAHDWQ